MRKAIKFLSLQFFFLINCSICALGIITEEEYTVKVFDVGQGNAVGIRYKFKRDGENQCETMLIDAGSSSCVASAEKHNKYFSENLNDKTYKDKIINDIQEFMLTDNAIVRSIIVTHAHDDHYNLISAIFDKKKNREKIKNIILSGSEELYTPTTLHTWLEQFSKKNVIKYTRRKENKEWIELTSGGFNKRASFTREGTPPVIKLLSMNQGRDSNNRNDDSIVLQVLCADTLSILLTGDATTKTWQGVKKMGETYSHILLIPHHGSKANTNIKNNKEIISIFDIIQPKISIFSTGLYNRYSHPHNDVYEKIEEKMSYRSDTPFILSFFNNQKKVIQKYTNNSIFSTVDHGTISMDMKREELIVRKNSTKIPLLITVERSEEPIFLLESDEFKNPIEFDYNEKSRVQLTKRLQYTLLDKIKLKDTTIKVHPDNKKGKFFWVEEKGEVFGGYAYAPQGKIEEAYYFIRVVEMSSCSSEEEEACTDSDDSSLDTEIVTQAANSSYLKEKKSTKSKDAGLSNEGKKASTKQISKKRKPSSNKVKKNSDLTKKNISEPENKKIPTRKKRSKST